MDEADRTAARERAEGFLKVLKAVRGRLLVVCHNFPDPDCIAAAFGMQRFLATCRRKADLYCGTAIGRSENRAFAGLLDITFIEPEELAEGHYAAAILVDTQPRAGNNQLPPGMPVIAVFDHHEPPATPYNTAWKDVRQDDGCTSAMICDYLDAAGTPLDGPLATALFIGIRTDTADLERDCAERDVYWYERLLPSVDRSILSRVVHPKQPEAYFRLLRQALDAARRYDDVAICAPGILPAPDMLCEVSELFLRLKGINWSFAAGVFENRIYLSLRAGGGRKASAGLLARCVPEGARVGGHGQSAGGVMLIASPDGLEEEARRICARFIEVMEVTHAGPRPILTA